MRDHCRARVAAGWVRAIAFTVVRVLTHPDLFVWDLCLRGWFATPEQRSVIALAKKIEDLLAISPGKLSDDEKNLRALFEGFVAAQRTSDLPLAPVPSEASIAVATSVLCSYWTLARERVIGAGGADPVGTAWPHLRSDVSEYTDDALNAVSLFAFPDKTMAATNALNALYRCLSKSNGFDTPAGRYKDRKGSVKVEAVVKRALRKCGRGLCDEVNISLARVAPAGHRLRSELIRIDGLRKSSERCPSDLTLVMKFTFDMIGASHHEIVEMPVNIKALGSTSGSNSGGAAMFQWVMLADKAPVPSVDALLARLGPVLHSALPVPDSNYLFWVFDKAPGTDSTSANAKVIPLLGADLGQHIKYNPAQSFPNIQMQPSPAGGQLGIPNMALDARLRLFRWYRDNYFARVESRLAALAALEDPPELAVAAPALPGMDS